MADKKPASKTTKKPAAKSASASKAKKKGFTAFEKAAMKERAQELRAGKKVDGDSVVLAKLAEMPPSDRAIGSRLHAIVRANAPDLTPKLWYGMPAYATKAGKVVCFFQSAKKFKTRYGTFAFSDQANLDNGNVWPTSFAVKELTAADEAKIAALVKQAVR